MIVTKTGQQDWFCLPLSVKASWTVQKCVRLSPLCVAVEMRRREVGEYSRVKQFFVYMLWRLGI